MSKAFEMISESLNEIIEDLEKNDGKNLKRKVMTEGNILPLTAEQIAELDALKYREVDLSDIPEITHEEFERMKANRLRRKKLKIAS